MFIASPSGIAMRAHRSWRPLLLAALLVFGFRVSAGEIEDRGLFEITRASTVDYPLLVLPMLSVEGADITGGWRLSATEEAGFLVYRATRGGREHSVRVALSAPRRVAFNPDKERFERLAQNLRVELRDAYALDEVVEAAGGTGGKAYPYLGFALVHLPAESDPVRAAASVRALPAVADVRLTVKGPKRKPR